jgi:arylsulfatase A-like enzyme
MPVRSILKPSLLLPLLMPGFSPAQSKLGNPNIMIFIVDDMGWQDTSVPFWKETTPFNRRYHTPNMERLAAQGMKFTQAYACSVSSPTRVSLITGMNAARHRVTNWTLEKNKPTDGENQALKFPDWNMNGMSPVPGVEHTAYATPLAEILRQNGYFTILAGKAHFGAMQTPAENPLNLGFDINIAGHAAGAPGSYLGEKNYGNETPGGHTLPWGVPGLEKYHQTGVFLTEALTREAIRAADSALALHKPFFLYMSHYAVHVPFAPDQRFIGRYRGAGLPETEAMYAALLEGMDKSLGDLMDHFAQKGIAGNTIILFISDNGGLSAHGRAGEPNSHNKPLASGKGSAYEGGIRVPMMAKWSDVVSPGTLCNKYLIIEDFFPTILEMAGIRHYTTIQHVDGRSFLPLLKMKGDPSKGRDLFWHYPNDWGISGPGIGAYSAVRSGNWKLIYFHAGQRFELYDLDADIGENHNLSATHPEIVRRLAVKLGKYLRKVQAQMPVNVNTGKPVQFPDETGVNSLP